MYSVIIPAFNSELYIAEAINSVLRQTAQEFEIIVIDDGSSDNTWGIISKFNDPRIKCFYQNNSGPGSARNTGINKSQGEFIAFLDSDDIWRSEKMAIQLEYLHKNPDIGVVYSDFSYFNNFGTVNKNFPIEKGLPRLSGKIFEDLFLRCFIQTSTVVVRREIFNDVGFFNEKLYSGQDYEMWLRMSLFTNFCYIPYVLADYRDHRFSISMNILNFKKPPEIVVLESLYNDYSKYINQIPSHKLKQRFARPYFQYGYMAMRHKNYHLAKKYFWKSFKITPFYKKSLMFCFLCTLFPYLPMKHFFERKSFFPFLD